MRFVIEVGDIEKETVEFAFNQLLGRTVIRRNGQEFKRNVRLFSEPVFEHHIIDLHERQRALLRIEKRRKHLVGSRYSVYVNNQLVQCHEGI